MSGKEIWRQRKKHKPSGMCPQLPDLPAEIGAEIANFNSDMAKVYTNYIWSQCARTKFSAELGDFKLPYTETSAVEKAPMFFGKESQFGKFW